MVSHLYVIILLIRFGQVFIAHTTQSLYLRRLDPPLVPYRRNSLSILVLQGLIPRFYTVRALRDITLAAF